jgi:D-amino peptidase
VAGVMNIVDWICPPGQYFETGKKFLTEEVNAAIHGFVECGFDDIVVVDGQKKETG